MEKADQGHCSKGNLERTDVRKRCQAQPECNIIIRNRDLKEQLHLGSERTSSRIFRKALMLEIGK
jgi:hypothetical protein